MNNKEIYLKVFCEAIEIEELQAENATAQTQSSWDSLKQMNLIAALEDEFNIDFEPEDVIELNSFAKGIEILKKYNVEM